MTDNLGRLRTRLTVWYAVIFGTIVVLLGAGLFITIRQQISSQLDVSLSLANDAIVRATSIRETEEASASGAVMDAVGELKIPDRKLYLFDGAATPLVPATAPPPIVDAARSAIRDSTSLITLHPPHDHAVRVSARRFRSRAGRVYAAVAVADRVHLENQYTALILAFGAAALGALVLFVAGGWFLTQKSIEPVEHTMDYMRRFMADAAHELRTPLAVVRSRAEVALASTDDPLRQRDALAAIEREATRLGKIVEDLLLLARTDAGGWPVTMKRLFLDDIVSDAVSSASALAAGRGVTLKLSDFEEAPIEGDEALVRQLALIILDNAVKFTPAGGSIDVSVVSSVQGSTLRISDTGIGIPPDQMAHVFERFYRGDAARARGDGAGLGLSIAQWIGDVHNARILFRSGTPTGTIVEVRFPSVSRGRLPE